MSRCKRPYSSSSTNSTNWAPAGVCTAIWYAIRSAWGCASTADRDVVSWNGGCQLRACWAGCWSIRSTQGPIPGDVAASITSGRLRVPASSRCGRCRCRSGIVLQQDRLPAYITWERYLANQQRLLQNGPRTVLPECPAAAKHCLTSLLVCGGLWPAHVRQLSEQIDRVLWVYAAEERGIDVLRSRQLRGGGRSRGPAGLAVLWSPATLELA